MRRVLTTIKATTVLILLALAYVVGCKPVEVEGQAFEASLELDLYGKNGTDMYGKSDFSFVITSNSSTLKVVTYNCEFTSESVIRDGGTYDPIRNDSKGYYYVFTIPDADFTHTGEGVLNLVVANPETGATKKLSATFTKHKDHVSDFDLKESYEVQIGTDPVKHVITLTPSPATAVDAEITAASSNVEAVVKPTFSGKVLTLDCLKPGTAEVTVTMGAVTKKTKVTVGGLSVTGFSLKESYTIPFGTDGGVITETLTVVPSTALDASFTNIYSADQAVVKASGTFPVLRLEGAKLGQTTVDVTVGGCKKTAVVTVQGIYVSDFTLEKSYSFSYSSAGSTTKHYDVVCTPANALNQAFTSAKSSDDKVARVTTKGAGFDITTVGPGECTIELSIGSVTKTAKVTVGGTYVTDFELASTTDIQMDKNGKGTKTVSLKPVPENAIDVSPVKVVSDDEKVVKASVNGLDLVLTAVATGKATVSVTIGSVKKNIVVTVTEKVRSFDIQNKYDLEVGVGSKKYSYTLKYTPEKAVDGSIKSVKSSDESVCKVSASGMTLTVEAINPGQATVTVVVGDVTKIATVNVTGVAVRDFSLASAYTQAVGTTKDYSLSFTPTTAKDGTITSVKSSDESVLKVSASGTKLTVQTVYTGAATVTVKMGSIEKKASFTVNGSVAKNITDNGVDGLGLAPGASASRVFTVTPSDAFDKNTLSVTSSDPSVISADMQKSGGVPTGNVTLTAHKTGWVTITATAGRVRKTYKVYCESISMSSSIGKIAWGEVGTGTVSVTAFPGSGEAAFSASCSDDSNVSVAVSGNNIRVTNTTHDSNGSRMIVLKTCHGVTASTTFSVVGPNYKFTPTMSLQADTCIPTDGDGYNPMEFKVDYDFVNQTAISVTINKAEMMLFTRMFFDVYGADAETRRRGLLDTWKDHMYKDKLLVGYVNALTSTELPSFVPAFSRLKGTLTIVLNNCYQSDTFPFAFQPYMSWRINDSRNGDTKQY